MNVPKPVNNSLQRLSRKPEIVNKYETLEDFVFHESHALIDFELEHFGRIKKFILDTYRSQDIFVSPLFLEDLIFYVLKNFPVQDFFREVSRIIKVSGLDKNSIAIFPLHSFGFHMLGFRHILNQRGPKSFTHENFCIFPQTNSFNDAVKNILDYLERIKLPNRRKLDVKLFEHFFKSRSLEWLEKNPLMLFNFKFSQALPKDNFFQILEKFNFLTPKLFFLYSIIKQPDSNLHFMSSSNTNNWATLDIKHILTIAVSKGKAQLNCIPTHLSNKFIFNDIFLNINLPMKIPNKPNWLFRAVDSIDKVYKGVVEYRITKKDEFKKFYRLSNSLRYFCNSFKTTSIDDKIVFLETAFEILLLDDFENNKKAQMVRRACVVSKTKSYFDPASIEKLLGNLVDCRNGIIHSGDSPSTQIDSFFLHRLFAKTFLHLVEKIDLIDSTENKYISKYFEKRV